MKQIPEAEEIILKHCNTKTNDYGTFFSSISDIQCRDAMIEFAKLHVEAALKEASEKAIVYADEGGYSEFVDEQSILNAYPLDNIK